jgi:DNA-binding NarL/FixJ family response regulator
MKTKIFIVDDHYMVVEGIRTMLQTEKTVEWLGHASNADSCLAFLRQLQPDVILMDINMPGRSGIELCAEVKGKYPGVFVLALSTFNQLSFIQKMMENGSSGYVLKNATQAELMAAIETVAKGKIFLSDQAAAVLRKVDNSNIPVITRREKEVLELLADGLTNHEMAEKLFVSPTTVDSHRKSLIAKLKARNTPELIKLAFVYKLIEN